MSTPMSGTTMPVSASRRSRVSLAVLLTCPLLVFATSHSALAQSTGTTAAEGLEELVMAGSAGEGQVAGGPGVDQSVMERRLLQQFAGGNQGAAPAAVAGGHQGRFRWIHAEAIGRRPLQVALGVDGTTEMGVQVGPLGQALHKGPHRAGAFPVSLQPGRHRGLTGDGGRQAQGADQQPGQPRGQGLHQPPPPATRGSASGPHGLNTVVQSRAMSTTIQPRSGACARASTRVPVLRLWLS